MLKRIGWICAVIVVPLFVISCGTKQVEVEPIVKKPKKERPLFQMMMHRPKEDRIFFEDDWFTYELALERVVKGPYSMPSNSIGGECKYQGATYTVMDKESNMVVRTMHVESQPCSSCHQR